MFTLHDVIAGIGEAELAYPVDRSIDFVGVTNDSRVARDGELFVALRAERDGHDFIADAFRRGARGVIAERAEDIISLLPYDQRHRFAFVVVPDSLLALQQLARYCLSQQAVTVVGITGSVGKTSTKELVAAVLQQRHAVLKNEKNFNNEIGLPLSILRRSSDQRVAVLEMGMYALGEIAKLCDIAPPQIGVVTNVGPTHLERLGTIERIAEAKSELVRALPRNGWAVLNADDARVAAMAQLSKAQVLEYGLSQGCAVRATNVEGLGLRGITFSVEYGGERHRVFAPLPGKHNVYACLAAVAVAVALGLNWPEIEAGLATGGEHVRISTVAGRNGAVVIDDTYNASPASVTAALALLSEMPGRRIAILGDMFELGNHEEAGHREVGSFAAEKVDKLIVVGTRARWIGEQALASGLSDVTFAVTKRDIALAPERGDYVLVKGSRGMAMEDVVVQLRAKMDSSEELIEL